MAKNVVEILLQAKDQASKNLKLTNKNLEAIGKTATKVGGIMAASGAAIIAATVAITKKAADAGDEIQKMSIRYGIATEKLSEWKHVAELSGATGENVAKSLKSLSGNMLYAEQGLMTYTRLFDELGITWKDNQGNLKELDTMLEEVADAIAKETDATKQAALASQLLGRGGIQLLPMLKLGAEGIRELREEAHELGLVWSREDADAAAQFNDDLKRLKNTIQGAGMEMAKSLLPMMIDFIQRATTIGKSVVAWTEAHKTLFPVLLKVVGVITGVGGLLFGIGMIIKLAPLVGLAFTSWLGPIGLVVAAIGILITQFYIIPKATEAMRQSIIETAKAIPDVSEAVKGLAEKYPELKDKLLDAQAAQIVFNRYVEQGNEKMIYASAKVLTEHRRKLNELALQYMQTEGAQRATIAGLKDETAALRELYEARGAVTEARPIPYGPVPEVPKPTVEPDWEDQIIGGLMDVQEQTYTLYDAVQGVAMGMVSAFAGAFANIFTKGQDFVSKMGGLFKSMLTLILQEIAKVLASKLIGKLFDLVFSLFGGGKGKTGGKVIEAQRGGLVRGGITGRDSVPVLTMPGEVILSVPIVKQLEKLLSRTVGVSGAQEGGVVPAPVPAIAPSEEFHLHLHSEIMDYEGIRGALRRGKLGEEMAAALARGDI